MDKQTIYKSDLGYFNIQKKELLKKGYSMTLDSDNFAVFELAGANRDASINPFNSGDRSIGTNSMG